MPLNKQQIEDAYNSIYAAENNNVLKKYKELSTTEIVQALLVILNNNGGSGSSGGGSGSATALKQDDQTALLESLEADVQEIKGNFLSTSNLLGANIAYTAGIIDRFGNLADAPATDDTGIFSFIAFFKRLLQKTPSPPTTVNTSISNPFTVSSTASVIPLNTSRKGLTIFNPLSFDIFVGFQSTVSSTSYAVKIGNDGYWEAPYRYTGIISIVSSGANTGNILVRELI